VESMSFSKYKILIFSILFINSVYASDEHNYTKAKVTNDKNTSIINPNFYDCNYNVYNVADIQFAKTSQDSWKEGKDYGYFTVIAYRDGLEHGCSLIRVLITKVKKLEFGADKHVIQDIQIGTPGLSGYIEDITLEVINNKLSLGIDIRTKEEPRLILKQSLVVDLSGKVINLIPFKHSPTLVDVF